MEKLLSFLTNIDFGRLDEATEVRAAFNAVEWDYTWIVLLLAGVVFVGSLYIGQLYRRESVRVSPAMRWFLTGLRVLALLVVVFVLLGPKLIMKKEIPKEESIVILADVSRSMTLPWATTDPTALVPLGKMLGRVSPHRNAADDPLDEVEQDELAAVRRIEALRHILTDKQLGVVDRLRDTYNVTVFAVNTPPRKSVGPGEAAVASTVASGLETLGVYPKIEENGQPAEGETPASLALPEEQADLGPTSPIGRNIREALKRMADTPGLGGKAVVGIVYLGDGQVNEGETLRTTGQYLGRQDIPVYAVGLGYHKSPPDLAVTNLLMDSLLAKGQEASASFRVASTSFDEQVDREVVFEVLANEAGSEPRLVDTRIAGETVSRTAHKITIPKGEDSIDCQVVFTPDKPGRYIYTVRVRPAEREVIRDNNSTSRLVEVSEVKLKVLLVDHYPRWEYRYLRDLLVRDSERIDSACFLVFDWANIAPEGTMDEVRTLPNTVDELAKFDVIIIGDMPFSLMSTAMAHSDGKPFVTMLNEVVSKREVGVIFMAGEHYNPFEYGDRNMKIFRGREYSLADLLPVYVYPEGKDANVGVTITKSYPIEVTPEGYASPIMKFVEDARENRRIWQSMEEMFWYATVSGAKPGASVLAEHPMDRVPGSRADTRPKIPLIATQRYGAGHVLYMGIDETWRWRFRVSDLYTARFWNSAIRYVARKRRSEHIKLEVARDQYYIGEKVEVTAQLWKKNGDPLFADKVQAEAIPEAEGREPIRFDLTPMRRGDGEDAPRTDDGRYRGTFVARHLGAYEIVVEHPDDILVTVGDEQQLEVARINLMVTEPQLEYENPAMAYDELQALADTTRGRFIGLEEIKLLPNILKERRQPDYVRDEFAIDRAPLMFILFLLAITGEWVARKWNRML